MNKETPMKQQKVKIAVLVSGGGTNLQALIDAEKTGILHNGTLTLVIANTANAYALERARQNGIATACITKKECGSTQQMEQQMLQILQQNNIDLIVLAGYLSIISPEFIAKYPNRILNIHPSLIPSFCGKGFYGLKVHEAALEKGVKITGATVHFVNEIPDDGKIIMQKAVTVKENDTPEILQKRVMRLAEWKILPLATQQICQTILQEQEKE